jgi:hypothetical protein
MFGRLPALVVLFTLTVDGVRPASYTDRELGGLEHKQTCGHCHRQLPVALQLGRREPVRGLALCHDAHMTTALLDRDPLQDWL